MMRASTSIAIAAAEAIWWAADRVAAVGHAIVHLGDNLGDAGHTLLDRWAAVADRIGADA